MHHLYLSHQPDMEALGKERELMVDWCGENGVVDFVVLEEMLTGGRITARQIEGLLEGIGQGDTVVTASLARMGRSLNMLCAVVRGIIGRGARVVAVDSGRVYEKDGETDAFMDSLEMAASLQSEIMAQRGMEAVAGMRKGGRTVGRPSGSRKARQKSVLYGKEQTILDLFDSGERISSIARKVGVPRSTVDWFIKNHPQG